ncbi:MAG: putative Fe-S cluster assembly protein SufT [Candidatus Marinimicrobia bacterium]|nr:putative Fe-S cluster assembly protein SufT [Candidatus Neomarinimicrobiota bacterium]
MDTEKIILERNVKAFLIPSGDKVTLQKGEPVSITQALGGSYTVMLNGNLFKLDGEDADAIGKKNVQTIINPSDNQNKEVSEQQVWDQLKTVYDPEIPINIVDLGLIYDCKVTDLKDGSKVDIKMTLTAPGCGMGPIITEEAKQKTQGIPGVIDVHVELVWEPLWNREMMSETALLQLGIL